MQFFVSTRHGGRFRVINLAHINYVDFVSLDNNPETPERCTIYFNGSDKSLSLDHIPDVQTLFSLLKEAR